ncbi:MAG: GTP 3',8-cyclase MoaA [Phyllobacteriaceae bacterium]|nr:GTP 3',8-cyclase MoaA [Phyllobacteriaceae bacterium]
MTVIFPTTGRRETLTDPFGRTIRYLRVSVTDRCDFRCHYCMSEDMTFLPKRDVLSLEELERLCSTFVRLGTRKIRLTGGEPLVRKGITTLIETLGRHLASGDLEELTLTTNGSQLAHRARDLAALGIRRINVSLDTLVPEKFRSITRWGEIGPVLEGIDAALEAGLKIKINTVAVRGFNDDEFDDLIRFAHGRGMDMTLIETMPLGEVGGQRADQYLPLTAVRADLETRFRLVDVDDTTGGPARYVRIAETGGRLGFITPLTHNFCESCNRVRLTCTGTLYMCLGQDASVDLRSVLRTRPDDDAALEAAIRGAVAAKPKGHDFVIDRSQGDTVLHRHMNTTGG